MKPHLHRPPPRCAPPSPCSTPFPVRRAKSTKSNLGAERLTLPPTFISRGPKRTQKTGKSKSIVSPPALRRSWRLSKKKGVTASDYFSRLVAQNKGPFAKAQRAAALPDDDFCRRLLNQLSGFAPRSPTLYKGAIAEAIEAIDSVLTGKTRSMSVSRKRGCSEDDKENYPVKFPYVPQAKWVFQTPPNRKLHFSSQVGEDRIKPAVIETRDEGKVVYEMNNKVNVDLTGFSNRQEIDIDKRYMVEVANTSFGAQEEDKGDFLQNEPFELENYFLSLTCRPKKAATTLPRFATLKKKRDMFEPQPGCSSATDDLKPNVCFLDNVNLGALEESFTFKFTSESHGGSTTGHLFDFDGNKKDSFNFRF